MIKWKAVDQLTATVAVGWGIFKLMTHGVTDCLFDSGK
jgi:hypothetical protein